MGLGQIFCDLRRMAGTGADGAQTPSGPLDHLLDWTERDLAMKATRCIVPLCDHPGPIVKGYCEPHYKRWKRDGDPGAALIIPRKRKRRKCSVIGCTEDHCARGYCERHYERWYHRTRRGRGVGDVAEVWTSWATKPGGYYAVHARLARNRGPAREYTCRNCGGRAQHWAYNNVSPDPNEILCPEVGLFYTHDLSYYIPLCVPCHSRLDGGDWSAR